jgi:actin-like ATPase involved in cell morphogenesis
MRKEYKIIIKIEIEDNLKIEMGYCTLRLFDINTVKLAGKCRRLGYESTLEYKASDVFQSIN